MASRTRTFALKAIFTLMFTSHAKARLTFASLDASYSIELNCVNRHKGLGPEGGTINLSFVPVLPSGICNILENETIASSHNYSGKAFSVNEYNDELMSFDKLYHECGIRFIRQGEWVKRADIIEALNPAAGISFHTDGRVPGFEYNMHFGFKKPGNVMD